MARTLQYFAESLSAIKVCFLIHGRAESVDVTKQHVDVLMSSGQRCSLDYDYLLIATGTSNGFWRNDRILTDQEVDAGINDSAELLKNAKRIDVVGGGPSAVSVALNAARQFPQSTISMHFPGDKLLRGYHSLTQDYHEKTLKNAGVVLYSNRRAIVESDQLDQLAAGELKFESGELVASDAIVWAIAALVRIRHFYLRHSLRSRFRDYRSYDECRGSCQYFCYRRCGGY